MLCLGFWARLLSHWRGCSKAHLCFWGWQGVQVHGPFSFLLILFVLPLPRAAWVKCCLQVWLTSSWLLPCAVGATRVTGRWVPYKRSSKAGCDSHPQHLQGASSDCSCRRDLLIPRAERPVSRSFTVQQSLVSSWCSPESPHGLQWVLWAEGNGLSWDAGYL